jgi:hypothetical protein
MQTEVDTVYMTTPYFSALDGQDDMPEVQETLRQEQQAVPYSTAGEGVGLATALGLLLLSLLILIPLALCVWAYFHVG